MEQNKCIEIILVYKLRELQLIKYNIEKDIERTENELKTLREIMK